MSSKAAAVREKGVDSPVPGTSSGNASRENLSDGGYGSSDDHIFKDPAVANHWRGVFERAGYENRHRFDPDFTWTAEEEKKLVRKLDIRIMLWAWIMFCALDLHRRNINRAISDNMLPELGDYPIPFLRCLFLLPLYPVSFPQNEPTPWQLFWSRSTALESGADCVQA